MLGHHGFDWRFLPGTPGPGADGRGRKAELGVRQLTGVSELLGPGAAGSWLGGGRWDVGLREEEGEAGNSTLESSPEI